ncbi:MAG: HK97 family phage prohead protease [Rhodobacteraceae bacterium]|nr:HK97 family phage prohead protease [Paracoccaceae bacterium]
MADSLGLERKFCRLDGPVLLTDDMEIEGYASLFGVKDTGGDVVEAGAYTSSLAALEKAGQSVKMLWQHRPEEPIGTWDEVHETEKGLYVKGRLLPDVARAREAAALLRAGAIDGLSIGYRTVRASKNSKGQRLLAELELWEVSLVTFPMLPEARVGSKGNEPVDTVLRELAEALDEARAELART